MQVEEYLRRDDRAVLPLGSTEQHAYLSLSVDSILSEQKLRQLDPKEARAYLGDGNFGGHDEKPDAVMEELWRVAVDETRELIAWK